MGRRHISAFDKVEGTNLFCFDICKERVLEISREFEFVKPFSNLSGIPLKEVGGVAIVSPTHTHLEYMHWCTKNNIPFLVEKPISTDNKGLDPLISDVENKNVKAGVAFPRRNAAAIRKMKLMQKEGFIGEIKSIQTTFSQDFRKYRPDYQSTYYAKIATGGGIILDGLSHHVDLVTYFGGPVTSVSCMHTKSVIEGTDGEDNAIITLRFANGIIGSVTGNQFQKPNEDRIELVGTNGNIKYERVSGILSWNHTDCPDWNSEAIDGNWDEILYQQSMAFLDVINQKGKEMPTSLKEGQHNIKVLMAARKSNDEKREIDL